MATKKTKKKPAKKTAKATRDKPAPKTKKVAKGKAGAAKGKAKLGGTNATTFIIDEQSHAGVERRAKKAESTRSRSGDAGTKGTGSPG